jgi:hypothetical protein
LQGETNVALCFQAYTNKCVTNSTDDDDDVSSAEFCAACDEAFSTGDITDKKCTKFFEDFVLEGNCGFPAMTPDASTCGSTVYADRDMSYVSAAVLYFFTLVNLLALVPLIGKRDDYGMVFVSALAANCPSLCMCVLKLRVGWVVVMAGKRDQQHSAGRGILLLVGRSVW